MDDMHDTTALLRFWSLAVQLKRLRRQGWIDRGVAEPESAADHSWGVALLGWLLARERSDLNRDRVLLLGLIHDLPEAVAGDTTPFDADRDASGAIDAIRFHEAPCYTDDARAAKQAAEAAALEQMVGNVAADLAAEIRDAWHEYEAGVTAEARFVRQIDKFETLLQAERYAAGQPHIVIDSFRLGTRRDVTDADLTSLIEALRHDPALDGPAGDRPSH